MNLVGDRDSVGACGGGPGCPIWPLSRSNRIALENYISTLLNLREGN